MEVSVLLYCSGLEPNAVSPFTELKMLLSSLKMQMCSTQSKADEIHSTCFAQIWLYNAAWLTDVLQCWDNATQPEHISELSSEATIRVYISSGLKKYLFCLIVFLLLAGALTSSIFWIWKNYGGPITTLICLTGYQRECNRHLLDWLCTR